MLLGSKLNMKTKREHRNTNAKVVPSWLMQCRFAKPTRFAVAFRVHIQTTKHHNSSEP